MGGHSQLFKLAFTALESTYAKSKMSVSRNKYGACTIREKPGEGQRFVTAEYLGSSH